MNTTLAMLLAVVLALFIVDLFAFLWTLREDDGTRQRLKYLLNLPLKASQRAQSVAMGEKILAYVQPAPWLERWASDEMMAWAGVALDVSLFQKIWWLLIMGGIAGGAVVVFLSHGSSRGWLLGMAVILTAALLPPLWLLRRKKERARAIQRSLPGFLELLALTVEAGLGFEPALRRVANTYPGPLGDELRRALRLMTLGTPRAEALRQLARRSPTPEVANFVEAVNLSEQLGTSLARTLQVQVKLLRTRRRQRAEAMAQTTPLRIIPALVFFFLPALLLIYLAPPVLLLLLQK